MIYANLRNSSREVMIEAALGYFEDARSDEIAFHIALLTNLFKAETF